MENKCIRFYLTVDKMHHISREGFILTNWLPSSKRVDQCINNITFKFVNNICPYYLKESFEFAPHCRIDSRNKFSKFEIPFRKMLRCFCSVFAIRTITITVHISVTISNF